MSAVRTTVGDRMNPIFLQAMRQSLRGKVFNILSFLSLMLALAFSLIYIISVTRVEEAVPSGPTYFLWIYGALSVAVHLFVPFIAYLSLGNEWDENTYDLLVLSNLKPRGIVMGKFLSAMLLTGLWFCAFLPFLVFSFLLPGTDLPTILLILAMTVLSSGFLTSLALFLSAVARGRLIRTLLMAVLAAALCGAVAGTIGLAVGCIYNPSDLWSDIGQQLVWGLATALIVTGLFFFMFACTRLTHDEENRSTGLRVVATLILIAGLWWLASIYRVSGSRPEPLVAIATFGILLVGLFAMLFVMEENRLGRRVELEVPKNALLAPLASPWLPGGGRGVIWFILNVALVIGGVVIIATIWPPTSPLFMGFSATSGSGLEDARPFWALALIYSWLYLGVPALLFRRWSRELVFRVAARASVFLFIFVALLGPALFYFLMDQSRGDDAFEHLGNPFWMAAMLNDWDGQRSRVIGMMIPAGLAAGFLMALHAPGMIRGVTEVMRASKARRSSQA